MEKPANPFDILPSNLFNVLGSQGGLQQHYAAILLRIYELAEFNRFGLTRQVVVAEIARYLASEAAQSLTETKFEESVEVMEAPPAAGDGRREEQASWFLRRLIDAGWLEREQQADYTEFIVLPDFAFTLLEALRTIQQQKPREYTGQLYTAHQLITHQGDDFSPALALTQAYENVRQVVRGLNELNQNIRRYTDRVTRDRPVAELLRLQFDDYVKTLVPTYHTLKTSDHISRYRRDIVARLQTWQLDETWLNDAADELATQSHLTPAQAADEINHYMRFIINQLESLDPLLEEIDRRHAQYLRTSLRQIRYQLVSADGSFQDRLISLAREINALQAGQELWLPDEMPAFQAMPLRQPDANSFYTLPRRRAPFVPQPVISPVLDPARAQTLRLRTLQELSQAITPARIQRFVDGFLNGNGAIHIRDFPPEAFAAEEDLPWLVYTIAYGNHPETRYALEPLPGEPVELGIVRVRPFQLVKKQG
ncbi:MAG: Wadjet anti-phage system protein JetA family protein [Anaerolineae bacterium]